MLAPSADYLGNVKFGEHNVLCSSLQCSPASEGMIARRSMPIGVCGLDAGDRCAGIKREIDSALRRTPLLLGNLRCIKLESITENGCPPSCINS